MQILQIYDPKIANAYMEVLMKLGTIFFVGVGFCKLCMVSCSVRIVYYRRPPCILSANLGMRIGPVEGPIHGPSYTKV